MLDIAPTELLLVALVALVVIGPKDLPRVLRVVGQWVGRARGVARQFRSGFDEMVRQAEFEEIEKKWAEENARIMREHPPQPADGADAAPGEATYSAAASVGPSYPYPSLQDEVDSAIDSFAEPDAGTVMPSQQMPLPLTDDGTAPAAPPADGVKADPEEGGPRG